jgi:hypothetical protein
VDERVSHAFRLCLARAPRDAERKVLRKLYEAQREADRSNPLKVRELFATFAVPPGVCLEELAAWYAVATVLLNLDETITKG